MTEATPKNHLRIPYVVNMECAPHQADQKATSRRLHRTLATVTKEHRRTERNCSCDVLCTCSHYYTSSVVAMGSCYKVTNSLSHTKHVCLLHSSSILAGSTWEQHNTILGTFFYFATLTSQREKGKPPSSKLMSSNDRDKSPARFCCRCRSSADGS